MRIISGFAGGRRLIAPAGDRTRPTSDKIRGSLFNILRAQVEGAQVLDLFGGTGAMALEAVSRGAAGAVIVDLDRLAIEAIRKNTAAVLGGEDPGLVEILRTDYRKALAGLTGRKFDLVFLDPPYRMAEAYAASLRLLRENDLLSENAIVVCERARDICVQYAEGYEVSDARSYGDTSVEFLKRMETEIKTEQ